GAGHGAGAQLPRSLKVEAAMKTKLLWVAAAVGVFAAGCKKEEAASTTAPAAAAKKSVKIGVLTDMSGLYAALAGPGSVEAAKMAVEDFGGKLGDLPIEVVSADHQNKPDIGSNLARQWIDVDGVDVIVDVPTSSVALAVSELVKQKDKVFLASGPGSTD